MTLTRKLALLLAAGLTAFTLVTAGALITYNAAQPQAAAAQSQMANQNQAQQPAAAPTPDNSASAKQTNSAAQNSGEQAQAQAQIQVQAQAQANSGQASAPGYPISAEQAASLALQAVPNSFLQSNPMLVNFDGTVAYEVGLDQGPVYIDATTGAVLYNGANLTATNAAGAQGFSGDDDQYEHNGRGEREDHGWYEEHENGDD